MKKLLLTIAFCGFTLFAKAQDTPNASVEKSVFGVQLGLLGVWVHNEARLSDKFALRSEIGLNTQNIDDDFYMAPVISLTPKYYYNLNKRLEQGKDISGNSGNFLSLQTNYNPDWFVIGSDKVYPINKISIAPTWGMRRNIGKHFNYELGVGVGWQHEFSYTHEGHSTRSYNSLVINVIAKIGYRF